MTTQKHARLAIDARRFSDRDEYTVTLVDVATKKTLLTAEATCRKKGMQFDMKQLTAARNRVAAYVIKHGYTLTNE